MSENTNSLGVARNIHKATPGVVKPHVCVYCHEEIHAVPGGHGTTYVHTDTGAVAARLNLFEELRDRADSLVELCSQITGIPFDPTDEVELTLDEWFQAALAVADPP
jgi:hypothetical protein